MSKLECIISRLLSYLGFIVVGVLAICSLITTFVFPDSYIEHPEIAARYSIASLVLLPVFILICFLIMARIKNGNLRMLRLFGSICIAVLGLTWILLNNFHPVADQEACLNVAKGLSEGDVSLFQKASYISKYPFQSGLVLYLYLFGKLFGFSNWPIFRFFNVIWLIVSYNYIYLITERLFKSNSVCIIVLLLMVLFLPFSLFSHFIYGNVPSFMLCTAAIYYQLLYLQKTPRPLYIILHIVFYLLALIIRLNSLLFLLSSIFVWLFSSKLSFVKPAKYLIVFGLLVSYFIASVVPTSIICRTVDCDLDNGIPKTAWIAMGMQDGPRCAGWYNNYIEEAYYSFDGNQADISSFSLDYIKDRIRYFMGNNLEFFQFYKLKIGSQWLDPSFQSFWITYTGYGEKPADSELSGVTESLNYDSILQNSFRKGLLHKLSLVFMDVFQSYIYIFAAVGLFAFRKKCDLVKLLPLIVFYAGFLFHILWEAKSCYVIFNFVMLIPYAAYGLGIAYMEFEKDLS